VLALADTGADMINAVKQAAEFGLMPQMRGEVAGIERVLGRPLHGAADGLQRHGGVALQRVAAQVLALADTGADMINAVKQAAEFGLMPQMRLAAPPSRCRRRPSAPRWRRAPARGRARSRR
jgi:anti-sigma factor ChrR (cupin superfamily)